VAECVRSGHVQQLDAVDDDDLRLLQLFEPETNKRNFY